MRMMRPIMVGLLVLSVATTSHATPQVGILACGHGTIPDAVQCTGGPCGAAQGAFMLSGPQACPNGSYLAIATGPITYIQGVCRDQPYATPGTPCGGQFVYRSEYCVVAGSSVTQGNLETHRGWGRWRICYDSTAAGDCSGTTPAGIVIEAGDGIGFDRALVTGGPSSNTVENRRTSQQSFIFNSAIRNMYFKIAVGTYTSDAYGSSCGTGAGTCGFEGCLIKLK